MKLTHRRMLGDFFLMVRPCACTASGSCGMASETRFCTMTSAVFRSVSRSNVTIRLYDPSLAHCDDMYSMPSTPLTCCSTGAATVSATTWAVAPGYWHDTCTVGGVIGGYWAIGKAIKAIVPTRMVTIERTAAKIGRSMKKREITASTWNHKGHKEHKEKSGDPDAVLDLQLLIGHQYRPLLLGLETAQFKLVNQGFFVYPSKNPGPNTRCISIAAPVT